MSDNEHLHFVTGRLAERSLARVVESLSKSIGFDYSIDVLPITVAALMTIDWVARRVAIPSEATKILLPGYCHGDLTPLQQLTDVPIEIGPRDLHALPEFFGEAAKMREDYGESSIEILAEINHAPRLALNDILTAARALADDGADVIDVGCEPGYEWAGVGDCVKALRHQGHRVSIDSFNPNEVQQAVAAGAELVLSVNQSNREAAVDWGCEVVAIPDNLPDLSGLGQTISLLEDKQVPYRVDPILEPVGFGFAASLGRYLQVRQSNAEVPMMMGIGNLTELTDVDSAGINVLLLAFCEELGIGSVLTTQVINWARSSVRECDLARRLVHYALQQGVLPKHLEPNLVLLRDPQIYEEGEEQLETLANQLKDPNFRIFAERGQLHVMNGAVHLTDSDPYVLFKRLIAAHPKNIDPSHAFYLGYELAKAVTALTLGKQYRQDEALNWGFLTIPEQTRRQRRDSQSD